MWYWFSVRNARKYVTIVTFLITFPNIWGGGACVCFLYVSRDVHVLVCSVKVRWSEEKRSGQSECTAQAPREWVGVAPRGHKLYWAEVIELTWEGLVWGGLVGSRALNTICMHRPTLKRGGEAYTCTAPTASAPSCRTTDHAPAAAPLRAIYICSRFCSFYFSATFLLITFKRLLKTLFMSYKEKPLNKITGKLKQYVEIFPPIFVEVR